MSLLIGTLSGCVISNHQEEKSSRSLNFHDGQFEINQSTKSDVMQAIGLPGRKDTDEEGREYWEYVNVEEHNRKGSVIFLLDTSKKYKVENKVTFVFKDNLLVKIIQ